MTTQAETVALIETDSYRPARPNPGPGRFHIVSATGAVLLHFETKPLAARIATQFPGAVVATAPAQSATKAA